jgi:hypothetical protein
MTKEDITLLRAQLATLWADRTLTNETWLAVDTELRAAKVEGE